jgi:hypothetical protein
MAPVFLYPLALLGLLGVPALLAIYLLRNATAAGRQAGQC